jgi:hypothetical protein
MEDDINFKIYDVIKNLTLKFTNFKIKKLVNVYQREKFINGHPTGIGDYLRGCFFLNQVAIILGIEFDMDFSNHPIHKFFEYNKSDINNIVCKEVEKYWHLNFPSNNLHVDCFDDFINYLNSITNEYKNFSNGSLYLHTNSFPFLRNITLNEKYTIRSKITPNDTLNHYINERLNYFNVNKHSYEVIHIRCGDEFIKEKHLVDGAEHVVQCGKSINSNNGYVEFLLNYLKSAIDLNKTYILISDNSDIKKIVNNKFNNCLFINSVIQHIGSSIYLTDDGVVDSLLDFFVMAYSNHILSISSYGWGSGFSKWCSVTFDVPYSTYIIQHVNL